MNSAVIPATRIARSFWDWEILTRVRFLKGT